MFAVIETGGKQYKVAPGAAVAVETLPSEPGATVEFDRVLMLGDEDNSLVGAPLIAGAKVLGHVIEQGRGQKIRVFKYKAKSNYRRKTGHRQNLTRVRITEIVRP
jgi:large subunit ribosomal protein L21